MAILSKLCRPDNFESLNCLKLAFINIQGLVVNLSLNQTPKILYVISDKHGSFSGFQQFLSEEFFQFNGSLSWMYKVL